MTGLDIAMLFVLLSMVTAVIWQVSVVCVRSGDAKQRRQELDRSDDVVSWVVFLGFLFIMFGIPIWLLITRK